MLNLEEIRERLQDRRLRVVAERTGLSYPTVLNVRDNLRSNPTHEVMRKISEYLEEVN